jgi:hypothetical protein
MEEREDIKDKPLLPKEISRNQRTIRRITQRV